MRPARFAVLCVTHALACASPAHAGVVLANTRVVFPGDAREVTVRLDNRHAHPVLVEAWVERGALQSRDAPAIVPFAPHPPLVRIEPGKGQALRVHRLPGPLPRDRETLFWLNVLDVPPDLPVSTQTTSMKIALHTRVKLFHRPAGLAGVASKAPAALRWSLRDGALHVENPTPFHVSIARVVVGDGLDLHGEMVAPFEVLTLRLEAAAIGAGASGDLAARRASRLLASRRVAFDAINDAGGTDRFEAMLSAPPVESSP
ncbi:MAG: molecular chaperone [Lysobacter sp.]|nr:molecular chaperone [Lysobacter sp.]